jgi:hypothetical protein
VDDARIGWDHGLVRDNGDATRVRPVRADARRVIIPVARRKYFQDGGFTVTADRIQLQARSGRISNVSMSDVASVNLTHSDRGDTRVLLAREDGSVLAQDSGYWYSDTALTRLASAAGCKFVDDPYRSLAALERAHPGTLRYRWERHPVLTGFVLGLVILGLALLLAVLIR